MKTCDVIRHTWSLLLSAAVSLSPRPPSGDGCEVKLKVPLSFVGASLRPSVLNVSGPPAFPPIIQHMNVNIIF